MLIPNLSVLLAERRLTLSKTAQDTGISRTTLTALAGRGAKGIQFETLNTLCQYLKITPGELFQYRPFDLSLDADGLPGRGRVRFTVSRAGGADQRYELDCDAQYRFSPDRPDALEGLRLRLTLPDNPGQSPGGRELVALLRDLPPSALADVERDLLARYDANIPPALAPDDYSPEVLWPWE